MRLVREAQGITQSEIAEKIKEQGGTITQGAITQFEKMKISISTEKLVKIAPSLNLNPVFIQSGTGNPFKQSDREKIIRMFLPEDPFGKPDYRLIQIIVNHNNKAQYVFLKPLSSSKEVQKFIRHEGWKLLAYALLIKDDDENLFLLRRKRKNTFLDQKEVREIAEHDKKGVKFNEFPVTERESKNNAQLYTGIMRDNFDPGFIRNLLTYTLAVREKELRAKKREDEKAKRDFLFEIMTRVGDYERSTHDMEIQNEIVTTIQKMNYEEIEHFLKRLMPKISNSIKKTLKL